MDKYSRIYVAGHEGLPGSAIVRKLQAQGHEDIVLGVEGEPDLLRQASVEEFFAKERPEYVFLMAEKAGGIQANRDYPADFMTDNIVIQSNVIRSSYRHGVKRLIFPGSSCMYPGDCSQPINEEYLLCGRPEPTSEAYALAKIAGVRMCSYFNRQYNTRYTAVVPSGMYGPGDSFDPVRSHVIPSLISRIQRAVDEGTDRISIWGSGRPLREFIYVDDAADACVFIMKKQIDSDLLNIGTGRETSIRQVAGLIAQAAGFTGDMVFDTSKPDGAPRKLLDSSKLHAAGWKPSTGLEEGIKMTVDWYRKTVGYRVSGQPAGT